MQPEDKDVSIGWRALPVNLIPVPAIACCQTKRHKIIQSDLIFFNANCKGRVAPRVAKATSVASVANAENDANAGSVLEEDILKRQPVLVRVMSSLQACSTVYDKVSI